MLQINLRDYVVDSVASGGDFSKLYLECYKFYPSHFFLGILPDFRSSVLNTDDSVLM